MHLSPSQQLGARLRHLRKLRGLSGSELARRSGIPQSQLSRIELGKATVTPATLRKMTPHLKLSSSDESELTKMLLEIELDRLAQPPKVKQISLGLTQEGARHLEEVSRFLGASDSNAIHRALAIAHLVLSERATVLVERDGEVERIRFS